MHCFWSQLRWFSLGFSPDVVQIWEQGECRIEMPKISIIQRSEVVILLSSCAALSSVVWAVLVLHSLPLCPSVNLCPYLTACSSTSRCNKKKKQKKKVCLCHLWSAPQMHCSLQEHGWQCLLCCLVQAMCARDALGWEAQLLCCGPIKLPGALVQRCEPCESIFTSARSERRPVQPLACPQQQMLGEKYEKESKSIPS